MDKFFEGVGSRPAFEGENSRKGENLEGENSRKAILMLTSARVWIVEMVELSGNINLPVWSWPNPRMIHVGLEGFSSVFRAKCVHRHTGNCNSNSNSFRLSAYVCRMHHWNRLFLLEFRLNGFAANDCKPGFHFSECIANQILYEIVMGKLLIQWAFWEKIFSGEMNSHFGEKKETNDVISESNTSVMCRKFFFPLYILNGYFLLCIMLCLVFSFGYYGATMGISCNIFSTIPPIFPQYIHCTFRSQ